METRKKMYVDVNEVCEDWGCSRSKAYAIIKQLSEQIGAIACYNNQWIALFMDDNNSILKGWKDHKIQKVVVKRYDSATRKYIIGSKIRYYETADRWNTQKLEIIDNETGVELYLEVGKEYAIYESATPESIEVAEKVKVVVGDGTREYIFEQFSSFSNNN